MALLFEFSFYSGLIVIAFALIWIAVKFFKRDWSRLAKPIAALSIGLGAVPFYGRFLLATVGV